MPEVWADIPNDERHGRAMRRLSQHARGEGGAQGAEPQAQYRVATTGPAAESKGEGGVTQEVLVFDAPLPARFDGETYDPQQDSARLSTQLERVLAFMASGDWHTLREIAMHCGGSEAAVSARLRDMRKTRFGAHTVNRRPRHDRERGLWEYQLIVRRAA